MLIQDHRTKRSQGGTSGKLRWNICYRRRRQNIYCKYRCDSETTRRRNGRENVIVCHGTWECDCKRHSILLLSVVTGFYSNGSRSWYLRKFTKAAKIVRQQEHEFKQYGAWLESGSNRTIWFRPPLAWCTNRKTHRIDKQVQISAIHGHLPLQPWRWRPKRSQKHWFSVQHWHDWWPENILA